MKTVRMITHDKEGNCTRFEIDVSVDNLMDDDGKLHKDYVISVRRGRTNRDGFIDWYADILYSKIAPTVKFNMLRWNDDKDLVKVSQRALYVLADYMRGEQAETLNLMSAMAEKAEGKI